jgi:hypothetical protein
LGAVSRLILQLDLTDALGVRASGAFFCVRQRHAILWAWAILPVNGD